MKINSKTTSYVIIVTLIYTVILSIAMKSNFGLQPESKLLSVLDEIFYIIPIIYMIMVLSHLNEKKHIIITYMLYVISDVGVAIYFLLMRHSSNSAGVFVLISIMLVMLTMVLIIQSFQIQTKELTYSYCLYGFAMLFVFFFRLLGFVLIKSGSAGRSR